ncbi:two component sensor histidine kinase [Candidatus Arthromitus sp. SFB-mouse-Japan]|uniref:sensor histidine kinase n=1 Tax=Candidatus Arthromitus sp. SFB-mouse TaxID=49118 RepID=UPI00021B8187|nr:histidine kinase dimerization/phospho-acceptor domain-containing protein [Candidatus Arthromitus sp. SFB-mouse]EIA23697.1 Putative sensory transduction histidine kinase [Candidatus Arthromitus sp. SFB-2]EIA27699.1 Putative sensory transduction histidine kinase [Candidatus Arthromitus sp. SFB-co]EIA29701.1 Putative sensory transduction histidine kinase [Candidatus Arthromitus sp. SFB-mouse-SU]EGX28110.1 sensor histidine kinase [Candidatus Arthromitus sp. SFB-mouse-NYU]BAK57210.1 two componen
MSKHSIINKILFYFLSVTTIVFMLFSFLIYSFYELTLVDLCMDDLEIQSDVISDLALEYINNSTIENSKYLWEYVEKFNKYSGVDLILSDAIGYVYLVSNSVHKNLLGKQINIEKDVITKISVYDSDLQKKVYKLTKPLYNSNIYKGSITLILDDGYISLKLLNIKVFMIILYIFLMIIIGVIYYLLLRKILVKPIEIINNTAKRFASGDVCKRVYINSKDEIGELSNSFNYMAESLDKIDSNRREFLSNVSHELRTPLTTIIGFLSGILDGIISPKDHIEKLTIVYDEVKRLSRLVNDLLDLTAIESGKFTLRPRVIELNSLIKYTVKNFEQEIEQNDIVMEVFFEQNSINVVADEDRLVQVLNNLIANAIKYCDNKKRINISTKIKNNKAVVNIFNTAKLLSEDEFNNIWVRFYKNDKSRTRRGSTGLGLSIVRNIISQFREDIWVENRTKEQGVSFIFTLQLSS